MIVSVLLTEGAIESDGFSGFLTHYGEPITALALTVSTFGLWWSTARMNHIEKTKLTEALSHDNDNMADIAEKAIDTLHAERLHTLKRVSRRNRKGGIR
jgi:hypothetical protein